MDFTNQAVLYAMMVIPTFFALVVVGQGAVKMSKSEPDGPIALGFGIFLLVLIGVAYFMFIR